MSDQEHAPGQTSGTAERVARVVHPPVQLIHLGDLATQVAAERERRNVDHTAYTLRNAVALRQVLLSFRADGRMLEHHADGGVAIQVLAGELAVGVQGHEYILSPGDLLDLAPGLRHDLLARRESTVLLTIAPVGSLAHPRPTPP